VAGSGRFFARGLRARPRSVAEIASLRDARPAPRRSPPPKKFAGFRIEHLLRRGPGAVVFKACRLFQGDQALSLFRRVALKVLVCPAEEEAERLAQFDREAWAASRVVHPHVIRVLEQGEASGLRYLAMTFVPGPSLGAVLADGRRAPVDTVLRWGAELASALSALGREGLVHCDLKPQNIVINDRTLAAHLTDFGIARVAGEPPPGAERGVTFGTPRYMSPEQVRWRGALSSQADVYSLGATLYRAVTGRAVFPAKTSTGQLRAHLEAWPLDPRWHVPALPPGLAEILLECLRKDPARRPTPAELHARLATLRREMAGAGSSRPGALFAGSGSAGSALRPRPTRRQASPARVQRSRVTVGARAPSGGSGATNVPRPGRPGRPASSGR